jgi:hypothetical protein
MSNTYKVTFKVIDERFNANYTGIERSKVSKESFELMYEDDFEKLKEQCRRVERDQYDRKD